MVRIVRAPDGAVGVDPTGKRSGRGAYLCLQPSCWQTALKRHALDRDTTIKNLLIEILEGYFADMKTSKL